MPSGSSRAIKPSHLLAPAIVPLSRWSRLIDRKMVEPFVQVACLSLLLLSLSQLIANEFVAFLELAPLKAQLDPRSFTIATYALCGFANFSSIAIQIGGIGALAPSRKSDLARLGLKAVAVGSMANYMSACIAGILV